VEVKDSVDFGHHPDLPSLLAALDVLVTLTSFLGVVPGEAHLKVMRASELLG
jgi:hypothetical protein